MAGQGFLVRPQTCPRAWFRPAALPVCQGMGRTVPRMRLSLHWTARSLFGCKKWLLAGQDSWEQVSFSLAPCHQEQAWWPILPQQLWRFQRVCYSPNASHIFTIGSLPGLWYSAELQTLSCSICTAEDTLGKSHLWAKTHNIFAVMMAEQFFKVSNNMTSQSSATAAWQNTAIYSSASSGELLFF